MKCKRNKWNYEEGGGGGRFQRYHGVELMASLRVFRRERVAILLNDVWHSAGVKFGFVSSRILWIKFKFSRVKFVWWGVWPQ